MLSKNLFINYLKRSLVVRETIENVRALKKIKVLPLLALDFFAKL